MTIKQFVQDMMSDLETVCKPQPMTLPEAAYNLSCFKENGQKLPNGITAENYCKVWNALLPTKSYDVFVVVKFGMTVPVEAANEEEAERIVKKSICSGEFFMEYNQEILECFDGTMVSDDDCVSVELVTEAW